ncbi:pre-mRNA-splicing helicase BRR2 [Cryptococcus wingfieldii CBS 7118]|uniref:RNA helicase n=1 Tax=Cryptococcus wingfieldii CBS 7118 TaxID=1295528 RepID=A0A1E3IS24_9TREE|nr:pre-mRNA-splicing helicase BRR2 [Cryptococcus wingfieldii CBS 7118]ODN91338.1 pre-mRNA-splicing helicase BRR2 [Cryptococcus wingfieldii CBS 7118]
MSKKGARDLSQFNYGAMSSLVVNQDRSVVRNDEPTGAPESLVGRIDPKGMGARAYRDAPDISKRKKPFSAAPGGGVSGTSADEVERQIRRQQETKRAQFGVQGVLDSVAELEGLRYRPRTAETREVYELLLGLVHSILGDQAQEIIRSATDTILESLKSDDLKEFDKRKDVESVLGKLDEPIWAQLVSLSKKITDYVEEDEQERDERQQAVDQEGVAVLFEDEDEDEEQDFEAGGGDQDDESEEDDEEEESDAEPIEAAGDDTLTVGTRPTKKTKPSDTLHPRQIDAHWLQRLISTSYPDPVQSTDLSSSAFDLLSSELELRDLENGLAELFGYENFDLVEKLTKNRDVVVWCIRLAKATDEEKMDVEVAMREKGLGRILRELKGDKTPTTTTANVPEKVIPAHATLKPGSIATPRATTTIDIDSLVFSSGAHLNTAKNIKLPEGSFKRQFPGYEEIHVPEPKRREPVQGELVDVRSMPEWTWPAWGRTERLNVIQSKVYPVAWASSEPMLICAPTGAGKTNCAALTILRTISQHLLPSGKPDLDAFKIIYVSPMKALVQEQVDAFSKRFSPLGITVGELTGDSQMTKEQIGRTQIIVTTPEKWDVITRKSTDTSYTNLVRLIIVDEIHLLHDDRGPVLEAILSRTIRKMDQTHDPVRVVGLSATLPNYVDVAAFLRVDPEVGLFYFDASYRPVGLKQQFVGVTEKKAIKRLQTVNEVCYEKVLNYAGKSQTLVFVHSRKETAKTAQFLVEQAQEKETLAQFINPSGASREILIQESAQCKDLKLKEVLPFGFGIHHAGMSREDRTTVEQLFFEGHIQVLVCTATLAWGVNLPAHTVIIKGTQVYNPEKGKWAELSPQDVLQMLGRAGRPQFDTYGEGIIITNHSELQYYTGLMNQQLPIESQFVGRMVDNLNAEIVLGNVRNRDEGVQWLGYTYLYVRMLKSPKLYLVGGDYMEGDPTLIQKRADLIHSAGVLLEKGGLVRYDRATGTFQSTDLGRIASHYYITYSSMAVYNKHLKPNLTMIDLFRVFALSNEFKLIPVRQEEKLELAKLLERVPIPIKEGVEEPVAKVNMLLQAYISQLKLTGFDIVTDMVFIQQSAGRILRAMFEICLKKGWAAPTRAALDLCKMVERRMWKSMTPLRQFPRVSREVVQRAERKEFPWHRYFDLNEAELGELVGLPKSARYLRSLVDKFPRLDIQAHVLPLTRSLLKINVTVTPDFQWDRDIHGASQLFWILVEDVDGEQLLYHDSFVLRERFAQDEHYVTITVPISEPVPPNYYLSVVSDRWLQSETKLPVSFAHLVRPAPFPPHTPLLDLQPLPITALHNKAYEALYPFTEFNKIQTQVFQALYAGDENVFIGAPTGSGKTIAAEFALLRLWAKKGDTPRAVCIEPYQEMVDMRVEEWRAKFSTLEKVVVGLTGEATADLAMLSKADLVVATPAQWDMMSRRWKSRKDVKSVGLLIADELQLIGGDVGSTYEVIVSRTRYAAQQLETPIRIVACSVSLSNAKDLGDWIGATSQTIFNFSPSARPLPLEVHLQSFNVPHFPSLMLAMAKPAYLSIVEHASTRPTICFVPSRKQCKLSANDILTYTLADEDEGRFLNVDREELEPHLERLQDEDLKETLRYGIGFYHEALSKVDKKIVTGLFEQGAIRVLVASKDTAWSLPVTSYMVIIMGVQSFDGQEHRYVDYAIADVLQMMGRACRPMIDSSSRCVLMVQQTRKDFFKKFLNEALPVESSLPNYLHDHFNAEIVAKTIENKQDAVDWCTWTWFYRRLMQNPGFYNLQGTSPTQVADYLSELVESTLNDLVDSDCIIVQDEMDTLPNNLGMIASFYYISYITVDTFSKSIKETTKLKGLLEVVSSAHEFEIVPLRHHEDTLLERIYDRVPVKLQNVDYTSPYFKTFLLLQAHFSRLTLPPDLAIDQALVLSKITGLLSACVDVMSSKSYLGCLGAMDLSQMCVQAVWDRDSPLKQVPYFDRDVLARFKEKNLDSVYDIMELEDDERNDLLRMNDRQLARVAKFVNSYPNVEVSYSVANASSLNASESVELNVTLDREVDEDDPEAGQQADAPHFPHKKMVSWWLVVGDDATKNLYAIKKVTMTKATAKAKLELQLPEGEWALKLYLICDSYAGADQDFELEKLKVAEGESSDEDDSDDDEDEMEVDK